MKRIGIATALIIAGSAVAAASSSRPFDPTLDPVFQLARARSIAIKQRKNLLLDAGGNWCAACLILDRLFTHDATLGRLLSTNYVLVHVNVSPQNLNASFFSRFPKPTGYPFLIVVNPSATKVLHAQDGLALQRSSKPQDGYDPGSVAQFLLRWRPQV